MSLLRVTGKESGAGVSFSLRAHLFMLVAAIAVPLVAVTGYSIYDDTRRSIAEANATVRTLATIIAANTARTLASNRERMEILAMRPRMRAVDENRCDPILADFRELFPRFANLTTIDLNGRAVCSAVPQPGGKPVNVFKTEWFQRALAAPRFLAGNPFRGPITGKWVSVLVSPIYSEQHELKGFIGLPLDLAAFDPNIAGVAVPADSRYGIIGGDGTIIWRNLDREQIIGTNRRAMDMVHKTLIVKDGVFEAAGIDGVARYFAVTPIPDTPWYAFIGVPSAEMHAQARDRALRGSFVAVAGMALIALLALFLARRIEKPMRALAAAAHAVKGGDIDARALAAGPQEVVDVAVEFNAMVAAWSTSSRQLSKSEDRYRRLFADSKVAMLLIDPADDRIVDANVAACAYYGYSPATLKAMSVLDINILGPDQIHAAMALARDQGKDRFEFRHRLANGELRDVQVSSGPIEIDGRILLLSIVLDVTERKQAEKEREQYFKFFTASSDLMGIADPHGSFKKVNPAFVKTLGYAESELLERPFIEFVHPDDRQSTLEEMTLQLQRGYSLNFENRYVCKDGSVRHLSWHAQVNVEEELTYATARDITEYKRMETELREMATIDFLTGLYNRRKFMTRMDEQLARLQRGVTSIVTVLMLDLDHFKRINDTYGHGIGDLVLKHFAQTIGAELRKIDTVGRIGGEEFGIILPGADAKAALMFSERMCRTVMNQPLLHEGQPIPVTVSIGVAAMSAADSSAELALARADAALYRAKAAGRNRVEVAADVAAV